MRRHRRSLCVSPTRSPVLKQAKAEYREIAVDDFTAVSVPLAIALLSLPRVRKAPLLIWDLGARISGDGEGASTVMTSLKPASRNHWRYSDIVKVSPSLVIASMFTAKSRGKSASRRSSSGSLRCARAVVKRFTVSRKITILRRRAVIMVALKKWTNEIKVKFLAHRPGTQTLTLEDLVFRGVVSLPWNSAARERT